MKHRIPIDQCPFTKSNLVTQFTKGKSYDTYTCSQCGVQGKRFGLSNQIETEGKPKCPLMATTKPGSIQLVVDLPDFGLVKGQVCQVVKSPQKQYKDDVWVFSQQRKEPVRLLIREYVTCAQLQNQAN